MSDQVFQVVERYILGSPIAGGGMATVYLGRPVNLPRVVAVKQLRPEMARDQTFVRMFLDEAQLLCRIRHKNVAPPIDCFQHAGEFFIVMEYVQGQSLAELARASRVPPGLAATIMTDVLTGLDAAHDAVDCAGQPLGLVHRDVSPHNILVGTDGAARIVDFGIAKAAWRAHVTQHGQLKGKPGYITPEQLTTGIVDRRTDVYAAGIVLWELLVGRRLFDEASIHQAALTCDAREIVPPSAIVPDLPRALDDVVLRALSPDPNDRFPDARSMAEALLDAVLPVRAFEVGAWVTARAHDELRKRDELVIELENLRLSDVADPRGSPSRSMTAPVALDVSDAPPRGYRRYLIGAGLIGTFVLLGAVQLAGSRHPASAASTPVMATLPNIDETPATAANATAAASSPSPSTSAVPAVVAVKPPPPAVFEAKGARRRQDVAQAPPWSTVAAPSFSTSPNVPVRDAVPRSYDPLRDDRRR